jgi:hypothetical protein
MTTARETSAIPGWRQARRALQRGLEKALGKVGRETPEARRSENFGELRIEAGVAGLIEGQQTLAHEIVG